MMHSNVLVFSGEALLSLLSEMKFLPNWLIDYIIMAVENIPSIIRSSGIQILIFLAGLQSISPSVYEAAKVEGATGWESFWLITFPMISPLLITNTVYTIVDGLTRADNPLVQMIRDATFSGKGYGVSTAMSTLYFLAIALLLGLVFKLISGYIFYRE
ncbi:MAG TPA: ABC transporter permease subunit [Halanaerobiales bacterium]|nr:ABC transporter permease subunit [Halanaerobiales bacterium]